MPVPLPAISLVAVPGRRRRTLEIAREVSGAALPASICRAGTAIWRNAPGSPWPPSRSGFGTAIAPIYSETTEEFAANAAYIHEVSGGRFRFGIGVAPG